MNARANRLAPLLLLPALFAAALLPATSGRAQPPRAQTRYRWMYLATNLLVDKNVEQAVRLLERAAAAGYNGVVLADSKFMRWDDLPDRYLANVRKVRDACRRLKLQCIACVFPIGYSEGLLAHDPNLAAGLPVRDAPFVVGGGKLVPDDPCRIANGSFEDYRGNKPSGWNWADEPGKISFLDTEVKRHGKASMRLENIGQYSPRHGHGRICQALAVQPFRHYHVSAWVRTQEFESAGEVRIAVLGEGGVSLNYYQPAVRRTQDWKRVDVTFNSLENTRVNLYLGVWGGRGGKIWWDDVRIGPAGLTNVVRRDGAPLTVTSADGKTVYVEGKDFDGARDPKLGVVPWPGGFEAWHEPPAMTVPAASRLREGQTVLVSYYHTALIHGSQVACDLSEEKVHEILAWQARKVREHLQPDGYFMQHDEIRVQGWEPYFQKHGKTAGDVLAENVARCAAILRKADPGKPIFVWSDMFDPFHNARKTGRYYLVRGDGPWHGSWKGLPKDVTVVNWHGHGEGRVESLKHFAALGNPQVLAGYYDADPRAIVNWLKDADQAGGAAGVLYTTWRNDYSQLKSFLRAAGENR
ncbi:MAG TPA: hypothetical protein DCX07_00230 [Phycisphaerales bacterium]|nr:hypothetical protein [Phycisphaerales bacterium]